MNSAFTVRELHTVEEMAERFPLIRQLNPKLKKESYEAMLPEMLKNGYRQVAVFDGEKCLGVSGFWINTKIYSGRYIELDNVVVDETARSKGIGKLLNDRILEEGRQAGCRFAMLDAYVENKDAHRFYAREGYAIRGFHFLKKLF